MSEKRFEFYSDEDLIGVLDTVTGRTFNSFEIVDVLNEQQATISALKEENEQLKKQIQNYEKLLSNSYVGEEETLDGFVGKYVIWEDELQKYKVIK